MDGQLANYECSDRIAVSTIALPSPKAIHLFPLEHGKIWGRIEVGGKKGACWSTKVALSLKRVKTEEKILWRAYRKSSRGCTQGLPKIFRAPIYRTHRTVIFTIAQLSRLNLAK